MYKNTDRLTRHLQGKENIDKTSYAEVSLASERTSYFTVKGKMIPDLFLFFRIFCDITFYMSLATKVSTVCSPRNPMIICAKLIYIFCHGKHKNLQPPNSRLRDDKQGWFPTNSVSTL